MIRHRGRHSQKLQKALLDKDLSTVRHRDLRALKTFKNFTSRILYEMTYHLLQQVEGQCLSECRKTCKQVDIRRSYNAQPKSLKNAGDQLRCIFT